MTKLKAVNPQLAEVSKPKILVFGRTGVGKTWFSLDFPSVYYIDTEKGASRKQYIDKLIASGGSYLGPNEGSRDFGVVIEQVKALATEKHHYKTLVIDSLTKLYNLAAEEAAEKGGDDYGRDKKEANKPLKRLINWIGRLHMNVVLIAHEISRWGVDAKGNRQELGVKPDVYDKVEYELDLTINVTKPGPVRIGKVTKSRLLGFPDGDSFPWSYAEFAERYGKDVIEKESKVVHLATEEQLKELNHLMSNIKLPEGTQEKWLKSAEADTFAEVDADKMAKIIDHIKTNHLPKGIN